MSKYVESAHGLASERDAATDAVSGVGHGVITGGRRRRWSDDDKARIVRESREPGASVPKVARRYGLSLGQLYKWRSQTARAPSEASAEAGVRARAVQQACDGSALVETRPAFAPVVMATSAKPPYPTASEPGLLEIVIGNVRVRVGDGAAMDVERLVAVLNAVRRSS
jgi:transposase